MWRTILLQFVLGAALHAQFLKGLDASGPAPEQASKMNLFGQFAGDWSCETTLIADDGKRATGTCEWHFAYVLQGRAVQDVWDGHYGLAENHATTIRFYDPKRDSWSITYIDPSSGSVKHLTASQAGDGIVLEGRTDDGHRYRRVFSEITPRSFHWRALESADDGKTWVVRQEISARRVPGDREAIEKLEHEWLNGEGDPATLERILADDFLHPAPQGITLTKRQQIDWVAKHPSPADRVKHFEKLDVRAYGEVAIANGIVDNTDRSGSDSHRTIFTDVFVYRDGRWQAVNAQENAIDRNK